MKSENKEKKLKILRASRSKIGAEDMLATNVTFEPDAQITTVEVPDPEWASQSSN